MALSNAKEEKENAAEICLGSKQPLMDQFILLIANS